MCPAEFETYVFSFLFLPGYRPWLRLHLPLAKPSRWNHFSFCRGGKMRSLDRKTSVHLGVRHSSVLRSLFFRAGGGFFTAKPFLAHILLIIFLSCGLPMLTDWFSSNPLHQSLRFSGGDFSAHKWLIETFMHSTVTVPSPANWAFLRSTVHESTLCVRIYVCFHLFRPSRGGQLRSLFGVSLPVSDIHHWSTNEHMHSRPSPAVPSVRCK